MGGSNLLNEPSSEPPEPEDPPSSNKFHLWFTQINNGTWCLLNWRVNSRVATSIFREK